MDLHSGSFFWRATFPEAPVYKPMDEDVMCDVLIVGGGSSGAQCAYYFADSGLDVVVIEKSTVGSGTTSATSALLQYSGGKMFSRLVNSFGIVYVTRHMQHLKGAIDEIEAAAGKVAIDFDFTRRDTLYFASSPEDVRPLMDEYSFLKQHGFQVDFFAKRDIEDRYPFSKDAAIYCHEDGEMNPFKFAHALLDYVSRKGIRVFENTEMNGHYYDDVEERMVIRTKTGHLIRARRVIFAAGYESMEIRKEKRASFVSTFTVTTKPVADLSSWYRRTLIWETARPYLYLRTTPDDRIIIGGLDENTFFPEERDSMMIGKRDKLLEECRRLFPDIQVEPDYFLAAFYGRTVDSLPIIGVYNELPRCYFLFGFGDSGLVYSQTLAKFIASHILHGSVSDPEFEMYLPNRMK
ncbi:NAD(P)/FAD-dependent oxidoreductase [Bacillus sp. B-jedd]|uniref:NAD(P)/FAD-dependent oxidoreductase n=1 Tax=Bacillus sp. B-jedd TaxID=1476857 RepID=UPI0005155A78|nr:FAD-dependent oxidoreductase [Bacillus sp. B-jedd]CEG28815.1 FAD dependent oxidoreductase [Bacillus sp. B-jedd]